MSDAGGANRPAPGDAGGAIRPAPADVLVDLGRSHTRVVCGGTDTRSDAGTGLVDAGGAAGAAQVVVAAVRAAIPAPTGPWRLAVCAPGVVTAPEAAQEFADTLAGAFAPAPDVLVASDSAAWQAGAFGGGDGAVVALGTGAVVVARQGTSITRLDGLGLLLGDVGGGAWIGREALRAAARSGGPLRRAALLRFGPASTWPGLLGEPDLAARLAAFVPDVVAIAATDLTAQGVLDAAAQGLAGTLAPLDASLPTCVVGGLAPVLGSRLRSRTIRTWQEPAGDAIAGLRVLLTDPGAFAAETFRSRATAAGGHDTDTLPTEAVAPDTTDLDTWPTERLVARLASGHRGAASAVLDAITPLAHAADLAGAALAGTGRLVYVGAGTPGRLAVQDAAELTPTFALDPSRAIVLLAGGAEAGAVAVEGAEDDDAAAVRDIDTAGIGPDDVVVGITASGRTPYVLAAVRRAAERGAVTVGICNVAGSPLASAADMTAELLTGPEVIAGSTRLSAGTAQKIALNTLSTAAMVRAGATFGPWMVDMLASNEKLRRRAVRMVRDAAGITDHEADAALTAADRSVQVALVMVLAGVPADTARDRLAAAGSVRAALTPEAVAR